MGCEGAYRFIYILLVPILILKPALYHLVTIVLAHNSKLIHNLAPKVLDARVFFELPRRMQETISRFSCRGAKSRSGTDSYHWVL
jgi:hypothetical protein